MSRIALVNIVPKADAANYLGFNHGLGSISAVLKQKGHRVEMFVVSSNNSSLALFDEFQPHLVYVYLTTNQYSLFVSLLDRISNSGFRPVFVGGPHPTSAPDDTLSIEYVSGVCIGEGETASVGIAECYERDADYASVPNLWYKYNNSVVKNATGEFVNDLDVLPFPDRRIYPYEKMLRSSASRIMGFEFMAVRGCVYGCRYCINPLWRKLHGNGCVRRRSPERFIEEIAYVKKEYSYRGVIGFHDDIFTLDRAWLEEFADIYSKEISLPFWCNVHVSKLDKEIVEKLQKSGCTRVHMGIECGDEKMRSLILNKHLSNDEIIEKTKILKKHRMKIVTTFMIGLPEENEDDIYKSIDLCKRIGPDWVLLSVFCPYPGTALYDMLVEQKKLDPFFYKNLETDTFYSALPNYRQGNISNAKLEYLFNNFRRMAGVKG